MDPYSQYSRIEYSNQFHQLLITPSKHFTVGFDGLLNYQQTMLKITLKNIRLDNCHPLIYFLLRDKYSGAFYAEIVIAEELPPIEEFLYRAWSWKDEYSFAGLPEYLSVPSYAISEKLSKLLTNLYVKEIQPGFYNEAGVIVIRILESELIKYSGLKFSIEVQPQMKTILRELNHNREPNQNLKKEKYDEKWLNSIKTVILPPDISIIRKASEKFIDLYKSQCSAPQISLLPDVEKVINFSVLSSR